MCNTHCVTMQLKSGILWGWIGLSRDGGDLTTMQPVKSSTRGLRTESLEGSSGRCNPPPTIPAFCQTEGARQPTVALFSSTFFGHRLLRTSLLATATAWTEYNHFSRVAWNGLLAGELSSNTRVGFVAIFQGGFSPFSKSQIGPSLRLFTKQSIDIETPLWLFSMCKRSSPRAHFPR